jgi:hypothetical protein
VRLAVLTGGRRHGLVKQRKIELRDVEKLEVRVTALTPDLVRPFANGLPMSAGRVLPMTMAILSFARP